MLCMNTCASGTPYNLVKCIDVLILWGCTISVIVYYKHSVDGILCTSLCFYLGTTLLENSISRYKNFIYYDMNSIVYCTSLEHDVLLVLQVGTLDSLVGLSDQLAKLDPFMESLVRHVAQYISDILGPEDAQRLHENLLVGLSSNKGINVCAVLWQVSRGFHCVQASDLL